MPIQGHSRVVQIGDRVIAFPDRMSDAEVAAAARKLAQPQQIDQKIVLRLLNGGSRLADDAQRVMDVMPAEQAAAFREVVRSAINDKAAGNPTKARKILYALGKTAKAIFGPEYDRTKKELDAESRAALSILIPPRGALQQKRSDCSSKTDAAHN